MATTYCENSDLVLDNGKSVDDFLSSSLSKSGKTSRKDAARLRAYNYINDRYLAGRTLIPATHISALKQVEIDLVISDLMTGAFATESMSQSDWTEKYRERAEETLKNLRFDATIEDAVADSQNTGNGTVGSMSANDRYTKTEKWTLTAISSKYFTVRGEITGALPNAEVGVAYPEADWGAGGFRDYNMILSDVRYEEFPIFFTISEGSVAFTHYDRFTFMSYAASYYRQRIGNIVRG